MKLYRFKLNKSNWYLNGEMYRWAQVHCPSNWVQYNKVFIFMDRKDYAWFALRWS